MKSYFKGMHVYFDKESKGICKWFSWKIKNGDILIMMT